MENMQYPLLASVHTKASASTMHTRTTSELLSLATAKTNYLAISKDFLFMALQNYMTINRNFLMISISKHKINRKGINVLFFDFYVKIFIIWNPSSHLSYL